jgi:hypothetical protein
VLEVLAGLSSGGGGESFVNFLYLNPELHKVQTLASESYSENGVSVYGGRVGSI